jgi:hypothetical protein
MILKVIIEEQSFSLPIEEAFLQQAASFFDKMDLDMSKGWQMGRDWIESPDHDQKLRIVADKLLTAIENEEKKTGMMMAGYIKSRAPDTETIEMDVTGEMGHDFQQNETVVPTSTIPPPNQPLPKLDKMAAMQQAGNEVSRVFKSGKQYKFSMFNSKTGQWEESPAIADKEEAERMREFAFKKRFDQLST